MAKIRLCGCNYMSHVKSYVVRSLSIAIYNHTPIAAVLNVMLTGSGGTITEGQNYVLTCEANGDRYMAYTYMWLKDGVIVSGQNSSTYSFSPLLVVHSGRYSCRVSDGSMTMTSEGVNITVESKLGI